MFDVFYIGPKPNLFAHEQQVNSIEQAQQQSRTRFFWLVSYLVDHTGFDFLYEPPPWQANQRHAWPSQWQKDSGTYLVPRTGYVDTNYHQQPTLHRRASAEHWIVPGGLDFDYTWHPDATDPPYIYQFGTQWQKTNGPVYTVPGATEVKYVLLPRSTKITTDSHWTVPEGADTDSFDWTWHPDATESAYIYQFGTQHQRTGGPMYKVPGATEVKYVEQIKIKVDSKSAVIVEIDHLDGNTKQIPNAVKTVRYFDNYRDTLIRIAKSLVGQYEFVWICSSICDYEDFDFSWHPEQWQATMLHVFASDEQKFGDTFYMHVPSFAEYAERRELLEWYDCNFIGTSVPRRPMPVIHHNFDSHVDAVLARDFAGPLAIFSTGHSSSQGIRPPAVSLWREQTKTIVPLSVGYSSVIVPKVAIPYIRTQLYDYLYIDKTHCNDRIDALMDVIFISYDEPEAEVNWKKLQDKCPRAKRVHGVEGMENALAAAAELSSTPWYFCVFGKTELYPGFDFTFQPDYFQQPKHYIFYSENRVNKLVYGEMAIIMYNCNLILDNRNQDFGLDYTLSFPHEVIPIISTYGNFNTSPYHTWRTAFREVSKLYDMQEKSPSVETEYRIKVWETVAEGDYAEWALTGARDGREFYQKYKDDFAYRKNSFNWQWLRNYFSTLYGEIN